MKTRILIKSIWLLVLVSLLGFASAANPLPRAWAEAGPGTNSPTQHWSNFQFHYTAGTTLTPQRSLSVWEYGGAGCLSVSDNGVYSAGLHLPQGARIDHLYLAFYDTAPENGTGSIVRFNNTGSSGWVVYVASNGNGGYGTSISPLAGEVVDNSTYSYALQWQGQASAGTALRVCGIKVYYRVPLEAVYLPILTR